MNNNIGCKNKLSPNYSCKIYTICIAAYLAVLPTPSHAYLDPGSGSMLLYALAALGATIAYFIRGFMYQVSSLFTGKVNHLSNDLKNIDLVFYSEGDHYWNVFSPVIEALCEQEIKCAYLTSDKNDTGLQHGSSKVYTKYIGNLSMSAATLNKLSAKLVVMTMPQLGVFNFKRAKNVKHYSHIIHGPTDTLSYKRFAFDHFDSVLCAGPHQISSIRALESIRKMPKKELYKTGLTYYDFMLKNLSDIDSNNTRKTVLIAPTWGVNGLLTRFGFKCIKPLLNSNYNIIIRPHPQSYKSEPDVIEEIELNLKKYENLALDHSKSSEISMNASDILISDLSGIIFDFVYLFSKPVIVIDSEINLGGYEAEYIESEVWELSVRKILGKVISENDFPMLPSIIDEILRTFNATDQIDFRNQSLYNFGKAGKIAADQLIEILQRQKQDSKFSPETSSN